MPIETLLWSLIKISALPVYFSSQISAETIKMFGGLTFYYCVCPSYDLLKIILKLKNVYVVFPLIIVSLNAWNLFWSNLNILSLVNDQDCVSKYSWHQNYILWVSINKEITTGHRTVLLLKIIIISSHFPVSSSFLSMHIQVQIQDKTVSTIDLIMFPV